MEENKKILFNSFQICNELKLSFYDRKVVELKYSNLIKPLSMEDWKKLLKKDGINF